MKMALLLKPYYELAALKLNQGDAARRWKFCRRQKCLLTFMLEFYSGLAMTSLRQYPPPEISSLAEQLAEEGAITVDRLLLFLRGSVQERLGQLQETEDSFLKC